MPEAVPSVRANNKGIIANNIESKTSELCPVASPSPWLAVTTASRGQGRAWRTVGTP